MSEYRKFRDRDHEAPAPSPDEGQLLHDLILEVPRKDEHVVRTGLGDAFRRVDRDPGAGSVLPLLVWAAIDGVVEEVGSNAAVVEERVPLARRTVARDAQPVALRVDEKCHEVPLDPR